MQFSDVAYPSECASPAGTWAFLSDAPEVPMNHKSSQGWVSSSLGTGISHADL